MADVKAFTTSGQYANVVIPDYFSYSFDDLYYQYAVTSICDNPLNIEGLGNTNLGIVVAYGILSYKTVADTGVGTDAISGITNTPVIVADTGAGADALTGLTNTFSLADTGSGADALAALNSFTTADTGSAVDDVINITAVFTVAETGVGADAVSLYKQFLQAVAVSFMTKVKAVAALGNQIKSITK